MKANSRDESIKPNVGDVTPPSSREGERKRTPKVHMRDEDPMPREQVKGG
jgi:hypothetical protein